MLIAFFGATHFHSFPDSQILLDNTAVFIVECQADLNETFQRWGTVQSVQVPWKELYFSDQIGQQLSIGLIENL